MDLTLSRKKILMEFYKHPWGERTASEIEQRCELSHERVFVYLKELVEAGFLNCRRIGKTKAYSANLRNEYLLKHFELFELERKGAFLRKKPRYALIFSEFVKDLKLGGTILMLTLFGSLSRAEATKESDVDLLLVIPDMVDKDKVETAALDLSKKYSHRYGKEYNVIVSKLSDMAEGLKSREPFYDNLWRDRIVLYGESMFWRQMAREGVKYD